MDNNVFDYLSSIGFTPYEIKIYEALLIYGPKSATETAKLAGVPQPRVYDIFENLIEKGAVEVSPGKTKIYRAVPISNFFDRKIIELKQYKDIIQEYINKKKNYTESNPYLWLIKNPLQIREKVKEMIMNADKEIIASFNYENLRALKKYFIQASERGVTVVIVAYPDAELDFLKSIPKDIVLKRRPGTASQVIIVDRREGMISVESTENNEGYALYFDEDELIHILNYYFYHTIWGPSESINEFPVKREVRFTTAWLTCEAINYYFKRSIKISAHLNGLFLNGEKITIDGNISGIDLIPGFKHTFFIDTDDKKYSVGGKTARMEDIKMQDIKLKIDEDKYKNNY